MAVEPLVFDDVVADMPKRSFKPALASFLILCISGLLVAQLASAERLLVLGDSLSAGYGLTDPADGWVALWRNELEPQGHEVVNASVSGETTRGGLARLPQLLDRHAPDWVVLQLGGNDGLRGQPVASIRSRLQQMIDLIQNRQAGIILVGIRLPPNYGPRYTRPFFEQYHELAQRNDITHFLPFLLDGIATKPELMQADGIHPTAAAQPRVLDNIQSSLPAVFPGNP